MAGQTPSEPGDTAAGTAEGGTAIGNYNCGMINEGRDLEDEAFRQWYQRNCTN